jgi:hypothetical protein
MTALALRTQTWSASLIDALRDPRSSKPITRREAAIASGLLLLVAIAVYTPHVVRGGWYLDDWINVARMNAAGGPLGALETVGGDTYRLGLAVALVLLHTLAGDGQWPYLAIGVVLTAIQGALFYLVLRRLSLSVLLAAAAAAIFVVLPCIDATRLWMTATPIQIAGSLYLLGVLAALHGLQRPSRQGRVLWHAGAVALYVMSMLTYELIAGVVVVTFLLYLVAGSRGAAGKRLVADLVGVAAVLAYIVPEASSDRGAATSVAHLLDRAAQLWTPGHQVFSSLVPWPDVLGGPFGLGLLALGILGAAIAIARRDASGDGLRAWIAVAGISAVFAAAGLAMLLPADAYFVPRLSGLGNRVSAFAAFGAVVLLIAFIVIACGGIGALLRRPRAGLAAALVMIAIATVTLTVRELRQQEPWAQSWTEQQAVISAVRTALGDTVDQPAAIVTFRHNTFILPADVSVFAYSWDLDGALAHTYKSGPVAGHPWVLGSTCGESGVVFPDSADPSGAGPYGYAPRLFFVDARAATRTSIPDREACESAVAALAGTA